MNANTITTPAGERLVILSQADDAILLDAAEDNADREAMTRFRQALACGEEGLIPSEIVDRLLSGRTGFGCGASIAA